ncbi:unnamed protein product, partial [Effrenium voratum]
LGSSDRLEMWPSTKETAALVRYQHVEQDSGSEDGLEAQSDGSEVDSNLSLPWRSISATVALVCLAGVAVANFPGEEFSPFRSQHAGDVVDEWEKIPNISRVVRRAEGLGPPPARNLRDLFTTYQEYPAEVQPWATASCVIDAVQASAYLGQAVVYLYKAIDYKGLECPDDTPAGCAISVAGFVTSLSWVASYLALASSSCSQAVNPDALCVADWTALMADFGEVATSGAGVQRHCDFKGRISGLLLHLDRDEARHPYWHRFIPAASGPVNTAIDIHRKHHYDQMRSFDIAQCVFDVTNAAAFLVRATIQIRTATLGCPDPRACTIDIMDVISSFSWIARFVSDAASDCAVRGSLKAKCAGDISNLVAAVANGPASGLATTSDCADYPDPMNELLHEPTSR